MSFEFLNGTWSSFFAKANITSPRDDKLLLIAWRKNESYSRQLKFQETIILFYVFNEPTWVSLSLSPVEPLFDKRSLPARSIRFKTPCTCCSVLCKKKTGLVYHTKQTFCKKKAGLVSTSLTPEILSVKTKWLLEDCSFIWVFPTDLR